MSKYYSVINCEQAMFFLELIMYWKIIDKETYCQVTEDMWNKRSKN